MFYFKLNKLAIIKNREFLGKAEVKIMSFVTSDDNPLPDLDEFIQTNDAAKKKEIIAEAVKEVLRSNIFPEVDKIKKNHVMQFGDTGLVLYKSNSIPQDFNWQLVAFESDKNTRDNALLAGKIVSHPEFDGFIGKLSALTTLTNPALEIGISVSKFVIKSVLTIASKNKDDLIGNVIMSLNRTEHYIGGTRQSLSVPDMTGNMHVDYSIFAG